MPLATGTEAETERPEQAAQTKGALARFLDSDILYSFLHSKVTIVSAIVTFAFFFGALFAPLIAPHDPFDLASLSILDSQLPPVGMEGSNPSYLLGTDDQGRDILSGILYGARISLAVGFFSVALAAVVGVLLGLIAGYVGGKVDAIIMRIAEVQLTFPAILIALLVDGVAVRCSETSTGSGSPSGSWFSPSRSRSGSSSPVPCVDRRWWSATRNTSRPPA